MKRLTTLLCALCLPNAMGPRSLVIGNHLPTTDNRLPTTEPALTIGRLHYDGGGDWYGNPSSLPNLLAAIRQRTALPVTDRERVVTLTGADLWDTPFIYMTGHGNVHFSDEELRILRRYLVDGSLLHAE